MHMTPDELRDIIQAAKDGKTIQRFNFQSQTWHTCGPRFTTFNIYHKYRVRPEPKCELDDRITGFVVIGSTGRFIGGAREWDDLVCNPNFKRWLARGYRIINVQEAK